MFFWDKRVIIIGHFEAKVPVKTCLGTCSFTTAKSPFPTRFWHSLAPAIFVPELAY
jgi:hypothetical protein